MDWFNLGQDHIWLPYTQMAMNPKQLQVESASGVTIKLKDGRELIDGIVALCGVWLMAIIIQKLSRQFKSKLENYLTLCLPALLRKNPIN